METGMHCFGLNDVACAWMLDLERKLEEALTFLSRFGTTGTVIAVGLILIFLGTRRLGEMLGLNMHVSRLRHSAGKRLARFRPSEVLRLAGPRSALPAQA